LELWNVGNELVETFKMGENGEKIKIRPIGSIRDISLIPCILEVFTDCFHRGLYSLVLDLSQLKSLPPALIILLFEATAQARRKGGDVEIIHLNNSAEHSLTTFNPLEYLTVEKAIKPKAEPTSKTELVLSTIPLEDDIVALSNKHDSEQIRIPSRAESVYKACDFVMSRAAQAGIPQNEIGKIKIAVYEACLNVIEHAYRSDPNQWITISVKYDDFTLTITIIDNGEGFEAPTNGSFDVIEAASKRKTGGMGLHIIRRSMDNVSYDSDPVMGNRLIMKKNIIDTAPEHLTTKRYSNIGS